MTPRLDITYPDGRRQTAEIARPDVVIGRASNREAACDIPLDDGIVSRRHARVSRDARGQWWIEDLQSKNGTLVNDQTVKTAPLSHGDRITIGGCHIVFRSDATSATVVLADTPRQDAGQTSVFSATQRFVLPQQRLERLYDLNERLTGKFDRDALLGEVLEICVELLRFERAGIAIWRGESHPPQWIHMRGQTGGPGGEFRISRSLVDRALRNGERILINDTEGAFDPTASMISNNIRSAMCVPMSYLGSVRGVIYGDRVTSTGGYTREDTDFFAALGRLGAMGLANCQLLDEMQRRQQVEIQLNLARQIQQDLFPQQALRRDNLEIDAVNDPGQQISGDYYDYFIRPDGQALILVADVSGKGVPASLLTANLQAAVRVTLGHKADLIEAVGRINRLICDNVTECRFITGIIGLLDFQTRRFTCVNAGHPAPYLIAGGAVKPVPMPPALPLGLEIDAVYDPIVVEFPPGPATLVMFSDGVPDAENEAGENYGLSRLADVLATNIDKRPTDLVGRVRTSIKQFSRGYTQNDDITILAARLD